MVFKQDMVYDKRLVERHIKRGVLSADDFSKYLASLTDASGKGEALRLFDDEPRSAEETTSND